MREDGYIEICNLQESEKLSKKEWWVRPAILDGRCQRCNQLVSSECQLPNGVIYCPHCIQFGRLTNQQYLCSKKNISTVTKAQAQCTWEGSLTIYQQKVADGLKHCLKNHHHALVWAVTGAGKTEMLFPLILTFLKQGKRVAISSPRIDVCLELYPRICQAFAKEDVCLMYGKSKEEYREKSFVVCTTHQLVHFYRAFDLLIIDEIDAFPYEGDEMLHFASKQSLKLDGMQVLLTATPPNPLIKKVTADHSWEVLKLPIRFHQRPLLVPKLIFNEYCDDLTSHPIAFHRFLKLVEYLSKKWHVLVFCPSIAYTKILCSQTKKFLPKIKMTDVSAIDPNRPLKVEKLRRHEYEIFFTTTILERGVTIDEVAVVVVAAQHKVFTKSALVQIAGRADRKGKNINGEVYFLLNEYSLAVKQACQEIKDMNELAKKVKMNVL